MAFIKSEAKDWKKIHEGMESPAWYNVIYRNSKNKHEIYLSGDGSKNPDTEWTVGVYEEDGNPIFQRTFRNRENANKYAKVLMAKGYNY